VLVAEGCTRGWHGVVVGPPRRPHSFCLDQPGSAFPRASGNTVTVGLTRAYPGHIKVFCNEDAAETWFEENDPEGVAFEYEVLE
jgi:hypothetical protein